VLLIIKRGKTYIERPHDVSETLKTQFVYQLSNVTHFLNISLRHLFWENEPLCYSREERYMYMHSPCSVNGQNTDTLVKFLWTRNTFLT
jgi:hypothetical protein